MEPLPFTEGFAPFGPLETWYRITGDLESTLPPLVVVHGGPGMSHGKLKLFPNGNVTSDFSKQPL